MELEWYTPWEHVFDSGNPPFYKWFTGGKTNIVLNTLDHHQKTSVKNKIALEAMSRQPTIESCIVVRRCLAGNAAYPVQGSGKV